MNPGTRAALAIAALIAAPLPVLAHSPPLTPTRPPAAVSLDVYDRFDRTPLAVHEKDGRRYIVGTPGHEYAVRIRNCLPRRVLVVTSVDGVNVVTGETASPDQSGYVLEPYASVEIAGWRKSLAGTAAFFFTDLGNSYAARTGRPLDVGVIGVAVFPEKVHAPASREQRSWLGNAQPKAEADGSAAGGPAPSSRSVEPTAPAGEVEPASPPASTEMRQRDDLARMDASRPAAKLGTGHGRYESAPAQQVRFERESTEPAQVVTLQYDRRENLIAMGVLPAPVVARQYPNPFPRMRFAPDPSR